MTNASGPNLLKIMNWAQTTVTLVEINRTSRSPIPVLTEIHPGSSIDLLPYVDFVSRYFTFIAFSNIHNGFKIVKLGINVTVDDKTLYLEYKII